MTKTTETQTRRDAAWQWMAAYEQRHPTATWAEITGAARAVLRAGGRNDRILRRTR